MVLRWKEAGEVVVEMETRVLSHLVLAASEQELRHVDPARGSKVGCRRRRYCSAVGQHDYARNYRLPRQWRWAERTGSEDWPGRCAVSAGKWLESQSRGRGYGGDAAGWTTRAADCAYPYQHQVR